jgi:hypothetical protein
METSMIKRENIDVVLINLEGKNTVVVSAEAVLHNLVDGDYLTEFSHEDICGAALRHVENLKNSWYERGWCNR